MSISRATHGEEEGAHKAMQTMMSIQKIDASFMIPEKGGGFWKASLCRPQIVQANFSYTRIKALP